MTAAPDRHEYMMLAALVCSNIGLTRLSGTLLAIPSGIATAALVSQLAQHANCTPEDMGTERRHAVRGVLAGSSIGLPAAGLMTFGAFYGPTQGFYRDERFVNAPAGEAFYHAFARVPLATALAEEVIFRSAVEAVFGRRRSPGEAMLISAVLFGLWHVYPTIDRFATHEGLAPHHAHIYLRRTMAVGAAVLGTAAAGYALSRLRRSARSVLAPVIVHAAVNGAGLLAGWAAARAPRRQPDAGPVDTR